MRNDHPATGTWLTDTAERCGRVLGLPQDQIGTLRDVLAGALSDFPQESLEAEFMADVNGAVARERRQTMSPEAWDLWRHAVQLYRSAGILEPMTPGSRRDAWVGASLAWFEVASGTTLNQPVRLVRTQGRHRDMVVTKVEVMCDRNDLTGYAVFDAVVYRPAKTSPCQLYFPGDQLHPLDWSDLPPHSRPAH